MSELDANYRGRKNQRNGNNTGRGGRVHGRGGRG